MAAIAGTFLGLCRSGDRIVAARQLYGGSHSLLTTTLPGYGIDTTFLDVWDLDGIAEALPGAKILYCETIGNPRVVVANLPELARLARDNGVTFVVDSTFASPAVCRPLEHGADLVIHSATKFLGGHHDLMGGILCGSPDTLAPIRALSRELGPTLSPFNAWLALRGLATLQLRVDRACHSSLEVARALAAHPAVESVNYPGLEGDLSFELCGSLLGGRGGAMLGFDVAGGRDAARRFQEALRVIQRAASLGGTHSLIVHAASVTHTQLDEAALRSVGISEGFCRLSIGIEETADLIDDLVGALDSL